MAGINRPSAMGDRWPGQRRDGAGDPKIGSVVGAGVRAGGAIFGVLALLLCDRPPNDAIMPSDDAVNAACHLTG